MKGDFSRLPPPGAGYSGVWMQQGRVQLDQDWNEQLVIESERARAAVRDLVGGSGAPAGDPGFRVRARGGVHPGGEVVFEADVELELVFPGGELTVEVRVVVEETEGGGVLVEVEGLFVLWIDSQGRPAFQVGGGVALGSPEPIARGTPVLVSAAYDGRVAVLHLDGRPVAAAPVRRPEQPAGGPARLRLGGTRGAGAAVAKGFGGAMDEVRIWSHARTPAQVREAAGRSLTGREEGLAAYFPLDEGEGATAHDHAGARHAHARVGGREDADEQGDGQIEGHERRDHQHGHEPEPRWKPHELTIGSGRLYVDGIPCVAPHEVRFEGQPDFPAEQRIGTGRHLLYVDVWERYVSAAEDKRLREVALGGLDTTGRTRIVWQVKALPLPRDEKWREAVLRLQRGRRRSAMAARRLYPDAPASGNSLYRVEVFSSGGLYGWPRPAGETDRAARVTAIETAAGGGGTLTLRPGRGGLEELHPGQQVEIFTRATDRAKTPGSLATVTACDARLRQVTVSAIPTGLAVSDEVRVRAVATFLWSSDNAWLAYPVRPVDRATTVVALGDVGPEGLKLALGDLVEVTDERTVLLALPGLLRTVKDVDRHRETVTLDSPIPPPLLGAGDGRRLLRRWSSAPQADASASTASAPSSPADAPLPLRADQWTRLSDGVEVRFEGTAFRAADYWTIPLRVAAHTGIEWPHDGTKPRALPPHGIEHFYAALATVTVHPHGRHAHRHRIEVEDHRRVFEPLVALTRDEKHPHHGHHHHDDHDHDHHDHGHHHHDHHPHEHGHDHHHGHHHHEDHHHDPHHHDHGDERIDVRVDADGTVEVDVSGEHGEVDVRVDEQDRDGHEHVEVSVDEHEHHHGHDDVDVDVDVSAGPHGEEKVEVGVHEHGGHGHEDVDVSVDVSAGPDGGEEIEVRVDEHGRHGHDEEVRVVVHAPPAIPAGSWIFGEAPDAPEGFAVTGARLTLRQQTPAWHPRAYLPAPIPGPVRCVALGGAVYAFGNGTRQVLRYDPLADAWWPETTLPEAWRGFAVATLGGRIHLLGGLDANGAGVDWHRAYDPASGRWESLAALRRARWDLGAAELGDQLYAAGGQHSLLWALNVTSDDVERYDPRADAWTPCRSMHHHRSSVGLAAAAGRLYAIGGRRPGFGDARPSDRAESYNPATDRWKELDHVPTPRLDAALAELDGLLYLAGGDAGNGPVPTTQVYVPGGGWMEGLPLQVPRTQLGLAGFSGRLLAVGGLASRGPTTSVEECRLFYDLHGYLKE